jgi:hypothetical protein
VHAPRALVIAIVVFAAACDEGDAHFTTKVASDFAPARRRVSVLGVYKDGRMSPEGWEALAPRLGTALGPTPCDVGYNQLTSANGALADAIDEYARANGPTDDLLAQLAPAAKGDLVLVLTFAGKLPHRASADAGPRPQALAAPSAGARGGGRGMRGGGRTGGAPRSAAPVDPNALDISASLYSVAQARSVAMVAMQYSGTSVDEAMTQFGARVAQTIPGLLCAGWSWDTPIDPERVRQSIDE